MNISRSTNLPDNVRDGITLVTTRDSLLVDVICLPIRFLLEIPDTCRITQGRVPVSIMKAGDDMGPTNHVVGVEEAERAIFQARDELDSV
jgi:hypothetical protein